VDVVFGRECVKSRDLGMLPPQNIKVVDVRQTYEDFCEAMKLRYIGYSRIATLEGNFPETSKV